MVAVQDAEAPGREDEQSRAGKEDANQLNRQLALVALEAGRDRVDQQRRREHAQQHQHGDEQREQRADSAGDAVCILSLAARDERRIDRNERRRQRAFTKQVLQEVRNAERGTEGVRVAAKPKKVREDALADQTRQAGDQNAGCDNGFDQRESARRVDGWHATSQCNDAALGAIRLKPRIAAIL